jgi:WD40 repeat protein
MSANDPKLTADLPVGKPDQDPAATVDRSRQGTLAEPNAGVGQDTCSYRLAGTAEGARSGSAVPAIPDFEIEGELGRGGMGVVYRARQTALNRQVAIKMILGGKYTDPMAQARFLIEAEVIAALQHPRIVQLFQFGRHDDQPFFVLEFVGGGSLARRLKTSGHFTPREAATMVAKLADGMAAAHQKGVVHRDLKPANVLLTEAGEPKITDFGLAKIGQSDMTTTGAVMGTPSYMSPEQAEGKTREVGTLTDIYALGAILYELTTGRPPFRGDTAMATIQQVLNREPERLRAVDARIPRDLETICLKCLEKDAKKRYATAVELATELNAFLEGRPITARPVGLPERTWKWAKRNPAWTAGITAVLLLLTVATFVGFAIRSATHAAGLVQSVLIADTAKVPIIVTEMADYRKWTDPLLREENDKAAANSRQKLHTSLALLPVDAGQVGYLKGRLLKAEPHEVPVICDALAPHKDTLLDKLWAVAEKPEIGEEQQRLRAAAALAKYDPENEKWAKVQEAVSNDLVKEPAVYLPLWMDSLRPVRVKLLSALSVVYADVTRPVERSLATDILADYALDQPKVLADLVMDADAQQFIRFYPKLKDRAEQGLLVLTGEIDKKLPPDAKNEAKEKLAKRQANAAVALLRMDQPAKMWPLLKHSPDPRARSYLVHRLAPLGAGARDIVKRLDEEPDITIRRALILSLGEYGEKELSLENRQALLPKLQEMYRNDADPGLHAASEWLLRTWKQEALLKQVNKEWAKDKAQREKRLDSIQKLLASRAASVPGVSPQWYVNGQGQTMVVIPGPVEFLMGSPTTEAGRRDNELQHTRRITRSFALAATPVTKEQFLRFRPTFNHTEFRRYPAPSCAIGGVNWYEAVSYCNWLSNQEGIPEDQWCYEIRGEATKLKANYLSLSGYRLPTEAEMEYATRARALTSRCFGETGELLPKYAWSSNNSQGLTWPVGSLKPNDLGLFDVHGNVHTWCQDSDKNYPAVKDGTVVEDREDELVIVSTRSRVVRGGSFTYPARSAFRVGDVPSLHMSDIGFRTARTFTPWALAFAGSYSGGSYHLDWQDEQQGFPAHIGWSRFTPDGSAFLAGGDAGPKGDIRLWDVASRKLLQQFVPGGSPWYNGGLFLPDGKQLLTWYSRESKLFLWDVATGKLVRKFEGPATDPLTVAVAPDGKRFLAGGNDKVIHVFDMDTGKELAKLEGHDDKCYGVFSPDSKQILTYSPDKTLRLWDVEGGKLLYKLKGHTKACSGVFSPEGKQVLSYGADKTVRLWDAATGKQVRAFDGPTDEVTFASFLPDGEKIVAWGKDRTVRVWKVDTSKVLHQFDLGDKIGAWPNVALSPDGRRLLTGDDNYTAYVLDLATGKEIRHFENAIMVKGFSFSPDSRYAAAGSSRAGVYLWRLPE